MPTPNLWGNTINVTSDEMGSDENRPYITALADGRFVVAWTDNTNDVVRAQILNADGTVRGSSFVLSQNSNGKAKEFPAICALSDGSFVAVWTEHTGDSSSQGGEADVIARIFKDGVPVGDEIQISSATNPTNYLFRPAVTAAGDGFAVSWSQFDSEPNSANNKVWIGTYSSSGDYRDGENFDTTNYEFPKPAITTLKNGKQVAVWVDAGGNDTTTIRAAIGSGDTFYQVDIATGPDLIDPQVTMLAGGGFVVTWKAENLAATNGANNDYKVMAQAFSATGQPVGNGPVEVYGGDMDLGNIPDPVVTGLADGRFAVAWSGKVDSFGIADIKMRVFSATGVEDGDVLQLSPDDASNDRMPTISTLKDGRIVVAWFRDALPNIQTQIIEPREQGIRLEGNDLDNDYIGTKFNDTILGAGGHDSIEGAGGDDSLDGGNDNDTLEGGDGNDNLNGQNGEDSLVGDNGDDGLYGWYGNDILDGGDGKDDIRGAFGSDILYGGNGDDFLEGGANEQWGDNKELPPDLSANYLHAGAGSDTLWGGAGADTLIGGTDADFMKGGKGDDVYDVDNAGDVVVEDANAGTDLVIASVNWTLGANVENLTLTAAAWGVGNELANIITGSGGNDVLVGGGGADTLQGGAGDDTYYIDGLDVIVDGSGFDTVYTAASDIYLDAFAQAGIERVISTSTGPVTIHGGERANTLYGNDSNDNLIAGSANDVLNGGGGADNMSGGAGNDIMNGGFGADRMAGGTDDDVYYVDDAGDVVIELAGQGRDSVFTSVSFSLGVNEVEILTATGSAAISLTGSAHANTITGNAGNNIIRGGAGDDKLSGGLGKDTLYGNAGRDTFAFDDRDTGTSKGRADYIVDFSGRSRDKIDLRAIDANTKRGGDQKFSFIGTKAFSKAGEVRYEKAGKDTYVYLNTDNDKSAEAVIKLKGAIDLQKGWFLL